MSRALRKVKTDRQDITIKDILQDERKKVRLYLLVCGILLVVWGITSSRIVQPPRSAATVSTDTASSDVVSFSQEPVTVDKNLLTGGKDKTKNPPVRITIPSLSVDLGVKEAKVVKGYWEVFPDGAGFGLGSSYPEDEGNTVIFAHAREGQFLPLKKIKTGADIYVFTKDKWYSYKVNTIKEVSPSQTEVIAPTKEAVLTLYTCSGFSDSKRLIVSAKKTS